MLGLNVVVYCRMWAWSWRIGKWTGEIVMIATALISTHFKWSRDSHCWVFVSVYFIQLYRLKTGLIVIWFVRLCCECIWCEYIPIYFYIFAYSDKFYLIASYDGHVESIETMSCDKLKHQVSRQILLREITCMSHWRLLYHDCKISLRKPKVFVSQILRRCLTKEGCVWKFFCCLIRIKEPCVRKFEGFARSKILGISQTKMGRFWNRRISSLTTGSWIVATCYTIFSAFVWYIIKTYKTIIPWIFSITFCTQKWCHNDYRISQSYSPTARSSILVWQLLWRQIYVQNVIEHRYILWHIFVCSWRTTAYLTTLFWMSLAIFRFDTTVYKRFNLPYSHWTGQYKSNALHSQ